MRRLKIDDDRRKRLESYRELRRLRESQLDVWFSSIQWFFMIMVPLLAVAALITAGYWAAKAIPWL